MKHTNQIVAILIATIEFFNQHQSSPNCKVVIYEKQIFPS